MPRCFPEVVEQHAEEAAFLWLLRDQATHAPNYDLDDLAELDERLDAHLDGLRVAGTQGWDACRRQLEWREAGEVFAAACVALRTRIGRRLGHVLDVATECPELARGFVAALGWFPHADVEATVSALLDSRDSVARWIGIAASAVHRHDPGAALTAAAGDADPLVRGRAFRAAAELGRRDLLPLCKEDGRGAAPDSHFCSSWSAALLGDVGATTALCEIAAGGGPVAERACDLAARRMNSDDASAWRRSLADTEGGRRLAITAARAQGEPAAVPWLIELMVDESLARHAGEAFCFITGAHLNTEGLSARRPAGFESGPTDDPDDPDVAMDPDEHLPWPRQDAVNAWWSQHRYRFAPGTRYLMGRPITTDTLRDVLARGTQRQRAGAAVELVLLHPGQPLFEVRARADRQQRALAGWSR
ncbi:MAG: TIGR02270 family protein [Gemmatimonadaceae bacterium]